MNQIYHRGFKLSQKKNEEGGGPPVDAINPAHYRTHPSGVECIVVTEHLNFCLGNAMKYIWRAGEKGDAVEDLEKAVWYPTREIRQLKGAAAK